MRCARGIPLYQMHLDPRHLIEMMNNNSMSHDWELIGNTLDFGVEVCYTVSVAEVVRLTEAKSRTVSLDNFSMVLCVHLSQALALRQISRFAP